MPDYIQNTPRNGLLGYLADALGSVDQYAQRPDNTMPMGKANPVLSILSNALVAPMQRTFDRVSYGEPVTNYGKANVPLIPQDTADTVANLLGLTAVAPKAVNALKPVAQTAYRNALIPSNVANQGERGAIVWHGSPHKFDKFDASKIGTGEGAQAYGHGLYLAESPEVGQQYARMNLTGPANVAHVAGRDGGDAMEALKIAYPGMPKAWYESAIEKGKEAGSLYKVDLPDEAIAKMLDWDAPLSKQAPEVQRALSDYSVISGKKFDTEMTGEQIYRQFSGNHLPQADAAQITSSDSLRWAGIPGIRYLDGGSRGTGQGTSNFVVFPGNEGLLQILERNGQPVR